MTQPMPPGMNIAPVVQPNMRVQSLGELDADRNAELAARQVAVQQAEQQAQAPAISPAAALGYEDEAPDPEQAALEAKHGKGETFATQYARGALSALLAPGALVGAYHETIGKAIGNKTWEDFGRNIGQAATGRSALESAQFLGSALTGEDDALDDADRARIAIDEQEKAWPLLSTAAQVGGGIAFGVGTGGLASGGATSLKTLATLGAVEGAGAGAQVAYDVDAPLTEVWTSALIGGTVGAALPAAVGGVGKALGRTRAPRADLQAAFGDEGKMAGTFGEKRVAEALGFSKRLQKKYGATEVNQIAKDIDAAHLADGTPVFPNSLLDATRMDRVDIAERLIQVHEETGAALGQLRAKASAWIDGNAPELRPSPSAMAARIEAEVVAPLQGSISPAAEGYARQAQKVATKLRALGDDISLEELAQKRIDLDPDIKFDAKAPDTMKRVRGIIEDDVAARMDAAAERMGEAAQYLPMKRQYASYSRGLEAMEDAVAGIRGNNKIGLTDSILAAGAFASDAASGGMMSLAKGAAVGFGSKLIREKGPQIMAVLARKFARTPAAVDIAVAGGREAQDAMTQIVRAKTFIRDAADLAGPNPSARAVAENTAQEAAAEALAKRAGTFDPATWSAARSAPSPLARVLYRPQILDAVSNDLAATVPRSVAMRPTLDFDIDAGKLAKLTKGSDGPAAIGLVQSKVREIADALPPGDQTVQAYQAVLNRLDTADVAGALVEGHNVARGLMQAGQVADARALMTTLSDDAFGPAGKAYRDLLTSPNGVLDEMANPAKVRGALQQLELRGTLTKQIADEHRATVAAWQARSKLTGEPMPEGLKKDMHAIESLWSKGEEHVTLDGTRLGRIVEALDNMVDSKVAARVPKVSPQEQVAVTIKEALKHVEPTLRPRRGGRGSLRRAAGAVAASGSPARLNQAERLAQYEERLDRLSQATVAPDTDEQTAAVSAAPAEVRTAMVQAQDQKLKNLMRDMPKPRTNSIHGTATDSMSSEEIRLGNAMWEATMEPMSVFQDFARGDLDPDKVAYAWKQYPGLQRMAQLGVLDVLQSQMDPDERSALPDGVLTQLDYMLGFNGALQSTLEFSFSQRMTGIGEQIKQANGATPAPPSRGLQLPTSKPSLTERLAGAR